MARAKRTIPPNFGIKEFDTERDGQAFLKKYGFTLINPRSDYDVWETTKEPKRRAISYEGKGRYVCAQLANITDAD